MFFKRDHHRMEKIGNRNLLQLIYATKHSWDHAKETEKAVYESNVNTELADRTKLQEKKYLYLYKKARARKLHGYLNDLVIQQ